MQTIIVFSHLRWDFVYQRPQHILTRLAEEYKIVYVEEPIKTTGPASLQRIPVAFNVEVLRPLTPVDAFGFHDDQLSVLKPLLTDFLQAELIDDYIAWFYTPMALPLLSPMRPKAIIYDCMDELSAFLGAPKQMQQREAALLKCADLVLTGGPSLYEAKRALHPKVLCMPSAVDARHYSPAFALAQTELVTQANELQAHIPHPRLGFFGVIDERMNMALLSALAKANPEWHLVMVGPIVKIDRQQLPIEPNIHWLGSQPYAILPQLVAGWDVCLLPFALNESTRFISPTKTLEYMAAEKPIVSTPIHDVVAMYGDTVEVAADNTDFLNACLKVLGESDQARALRMTNALANVSRFSWDQAAQTILSALDEVIRQAKRSGPPPNSEESQPVSPAPSTSKKAPIQRQHVIIGAGPTGLSAAYHLGMGSEGQETVLIERQAEVGGWCRSIQDKGFTFDYAGHIMFSNDPYVLSMYDKLLGANLHWQNREAWIYSKNVYTRYPFQGSLYGLPPQVLKECLIGAIEARFGSLRATPSAPTDASPPQNFLEFIHRTWGAGIARHFAIPYNEKLWAVPLDQMETSWLGGRVPLPDLEQMIEGALEPTPAPMGPNARFGYPLRGGFQALMDAFKPHLTCELALNTTVVHVSPRDHTVRLDDGRTLGYQSLISTMPLPQLIDACGDEAPAQVRAAARALRHVSVRCVNLGVNRAAITDKHWIYYPEDTVFHRIFVQGNASPHCNPPGGFGLTCEITYGPDKPLPCEGQALIDLVVADCRRVGILNADDDLITANQVDMPCAYVVYDHQRAAHVQVIRDWLSSAHIILAGRYSEWEYYNSDHAFIAGRRAAEQAQAMVAPLLAQAS